MFCDFSPFLKYHHLSTHTDNTFILESYILEGRIILPYVESDHMLSNSKNLAQLTRAKFPQPSYPFPHFQSLYVKTSLTRICEMNH